MYTVYEIYVIWIDKNGREFCSELRECVNSHYDHTDAQHYAEKYEEQLDPDDWEPIKFRVEVVNDRGEVVDWEEIENPYYDEVA